METGTVKKDSLVCNPVAGWVVCTKGGSRGQDYRIYKGFNRFGTSSENDIILDQEPEAAAFSHCSVVYDDRGNKSYLVGGEGTKTWLNKSLLDSPKVLKTGDEIQIGNTIYIYIGFCGEGRSWKEVEK